MQQIARNYLKEVPITTGVKKPILAMDLEASRQDVIARLRSAGKRSILQGDRPQINSDREFIRLFALCKRILFF